MIVLGFADRQSKQSAGRNWRLILQVARLLRIEFIMGERSDVRQEGKVPDKSVGSTEPGTLKNAPALSEGEIGKTKDVGPAN
ncbi:hypothetical protein Ate02nite_53590 [Paractinoplanes tereljensis]|uniref:Uncharacterized protein n=1 Tax=Paractinoplanes tereljensis TaxID=571912 RepID=A0A919NPF0_9ACTN|nr:hypothetical protein Ate02nite_53590 [Actinoplanes tereljensis]